MDTRDLLRSIEGNLLESSLLHEASKYSTREIQSMLEKPSIMPLIKELHNSVNEKEYYTALSKLAKLLGLKEQSIDRVSNFSVKKLQSNQLNDNEIYVYLKRLSEFDESLEESEVKAVTDEQRDAWSAKLTEKELKHTLKNKPKGKDFKEWMCMKDLSHGCGYSPIEDKYFGWSHRAIYGFKAGDKVEGDNLGKRRTSDPDFTIKDRDHAKKVAMQFSDNVS